jgi:hypothetical protein
MKKIMLVMVVFVAAISLISCKPMQKKASKSASPISQGVVDKVVKDLTTQYAGTPKLRIERGVQQVASLWMKGDGGEKEFEAFCKEHFTASDQGLDSLFLKLQTNFEVLYGNFNKIGMDLRRGLDLDYGPVQPIDEMFGAYSVGAHLTDDFYANKIAFVVALNFPFYSLKEKNELGATWTRKQWAYARMGDIFTSRVPAEIQQNAAAAYTKADSYISEYNIFMGNLVDKSGKTFFPADMKLISHWGLRDELKSHYADADGGLAKQKMVYEVMKHIIAQDIPEMVVNNKEVKWDPYENKVYKDNKAIEAKAEPNTRYQMLLNNFHAQKAMDPYNPAYPTFMQRAFELGMEIPMEEVEKLFVNLCSSPEVKEVASLISKRLGRPLQPFDIWYNGFKAKGSMSEEELTAITQAKYPNPMAFQADMPNLLVKLGFTPEKAAMIASKIVVDPARGSGHAAGAAMKSDVAHLRTRIAEKGMNYKGYNIAVHEFGHNVEQTISLQDVDYYMLNGVPTTAFTEALAFIFQKRDLELLGKTDNDPNKEHLLALDNFWMSYEIMGVSLVDMKVWRWMYENPNAKPEQLKEAVIAAAKDVWNTYYAPVFGSKDEPILAIYSHMIDNPLYLSSYPVGHLIDFQVEQQISSKAFAAEVLRMYTLGRLTPEVWMRQAVGNPIAIEPLLKATDAALKVVK